MHTHPHTRSKSILKSKSKKPNGANDLNRMFFFRMSISLSSAGISIHNTRASKVHFTTNVVHKFYSSHVGKENNSGHKMN